MSRNQSINKKRHKRLLRERAYLARLKKIEQQQIVTETGKVIRDRFAQSGFILGKSIRRFMPDRYDDAFDILPSDWTQTVFTLPAGIKQTRGLKRGLADLNGMTRASLTQPTLDAIATLDPFRLGCFMGFMAARTRHLMRASNAIPNGMESNIREAEDKLFRFYETYPVYRLPSAFNAQTYSLGLSVLGADEGGRAAKAASAMQRNFYFETYLDLQKIITDADLLQLAINDGNAFAHLLSRHFKLNQEQEAAFAVLLIAVTVPTYPKEEDQALKDSEGRYKHTLKDFLRPDEEKIKIDPFDPNQISKDAGLRYAATDTTQDIISDIADVVNLSEGRAIHEEMVRQNPILMQSTTRIANDLRQRLLAQYQTRISRHLEDGQLDTAALPRLIADPNLSDIFYDASEGKGLDTAVTILVDNSSSMDNEKIRLAYVSARLMSMALERAQIPYEILGFTTVKGVTLNVEKGRTAALRHVIYKGFNDHRAKPERLSGMLCNSMFGGTPTSESLLWAAKRLVTMRPESRRILISIEDGDPAIYMKEDLHWVFASAATGRQHLKAVVKALEKRGDIQLGAIGIKSDVSQFYSNSVRINDTEKLPKIIASLLDHILVQRKDLDPSLFKALQRDMKPRPKAATPPVT